MITPCLVANLIVFAPVHVSDDVVATVAADARADVPSVRECTVESLVPGIIALQPTLDTPIAPDGELSMSDVVRLQLLPSVEPASLLSLSMQEDLPDPAPDAPPAYGTADTWRWKWQGVLGANSSDDIFSGAGFGIEHFFQDAMSIQLQVTGIYVAQSDTDAAGVSADLLWRWHFVHKPDWSMFLEGGVGVMWTTNDVPANGSDLNFAPQAALGVSTALNEHARLEITAGYHHISNGGLFPTNPSRDSLRITVGVSVPF